MLCWPLLARCWRSSPASAAVGWPSGSSLVAGAAAWRWPAAAQLSAAALAGSRTSRRRAATGAGQPAPAGVRRRCVVIARGCGPGGADHDRPSCRPTCAREVDARVAERAPRHLFIDVQPGSVEQFREIAGGTPGRTACCSTRRACAPASCGSRARRSTRCTWPHNVAWTAPPRPRPHLPAAPCRGHRARRRGVVAGRLPGPASGLGRRGDGQWLRRRRRRHAGLQRPRPHDRGADRQPAQARSTGPAAGSTSCSCSARASSRRRPHSWSPPSTCRRARRDALV